MGMCNFSVILRNLQTGKYGKNWRVRTENVIYPTSLQNNEANDELDGGTKWEMLLKHKNLMINNVINRMSFKSYWWMGFLMVTNSLK